MARCSCICTIAVVTWFNYSICEHKRFLTQLKVENVSSCANVVLFSGNILRHLHLHRLEVWIIYELERKPVCLFFVHLSHYIGGSKMVPETRAPSQANFCNFLYSFGKKSWICHCHRYKFTNPNVLGQAVCLGDKPSDEPMILSQ